MDFYRITKMIFPYEPKGCGDTGRHRTGRQVQSVQRRSLCYLVDYQVLFLAYITKYLKKLPYMLQPSFTINKNTIFQT